MNATRKNDAIFFICRAGIIAGLYVALTYLASALGLASGVIQFRISEILTILPFFTLSAVPGLFIGCLLSNILTGCVLWDIIFGSLATLLGAIGSYLIGKFLPKKLATWTVAIPPILFNILIVPFVLRYAYGVEDAIWFLMLTVGAGEVVCCYIAGVPLLFAIDKNRYLKELLSDNPKEEEPQKEEEEPQKQEEPQKEKEEPEKQEEPQV